MNINNDKIDKPHYPLYTRWNLYFHHIKDSNWSIDSYKLLYTFDSVANFWRLYNGFPEHSLGFFFLMREGVNPTWEDKQNINGGTFSFKICKKDIDKAWTELSMAVIGESIFKESEIITGISLHPKYNCYIVKIWISTDIQELKFDINLDYFDPKTSQYKKNSIN